MQIGIIQHVPFEGPAAIGQWARRSGHEVVALPVYETQELPEPASLDMLVVLGGPMGVYDEEACPWLVADKRFIAGALETGMPVLGICLGAQLLAAVLGARVHSGVAREIGWYPVRRVRSGAPTIVDDILPQEFVTMHWHSDMFDIPDGAQRIASTDLCPNQGFVLDDRVVGLQFHMETDRAWLESMTVHCGDEIEPGPSVQTVAEILEGAAHCASNRPLIHALLDRLASVAAANR